MKNVQDSEGCKISLISFGTEKSKKKSASEGEMWLGKHETPRRRQRCASNM